MKRLMTGALVLTVAMGGMATGGLGSAFAQDAAEAPRCGGLLCDLGIFGRRAPAEPAGPGGAPAADPTALPCNDFLCRAFGSHSTEAAPPPPPPAAAPEPVAEPVKHKAKKRRHVAKAATAEPMAAPAEGK